MTGVQTCALPICLLNKLSLLDGTECAIKWVFTFTLHENLPLIMFCFLVHGLLSPRNFQAHICPDFRFIQQHLEDI